MTLLPVQSNHLSLKAGMILNDKAYGTPAMKIISVRGDSVRLETLRTGRRTTISVAGLTSQIEYYSFYAIAK